MQAILDFKKIFEKIQWAMNLDTNNLVDFMDPNYDSFNCQSLSIK